MPVRSLNSSVLKWPDQATVVSRVKAWAAAAGSSRPEAIRIGYFGSLARSDWGVGSDVDLVILVAATDQPFERRAIAWDTTELPVPADVLVYTMAEWEAMAEGSRFPRWVNEDLRWIYDRNS